MNASRSASPLSPAWSSFQFIPANDVARGSPFAGPVGIRCHEDGRVFVVDDLGHRVLVFDEHGTAVLTLGCHGAAAGELLWPDAIHWDAAGLLYVADTGAHRIQVWTPDGRYVREFGRSGSSRISRLLRFDRSRVLDHPRDVWIDGDQQVYVADFGSGVVRVFDTGGRLTRSIGADGHDRGTLSRPLGVAVSRDGRVFVTDAGTHQVHIFERTGKLLAIIGASGSADGEFQSPHGVAFGADDFTYVADRGNARVQVLSPEGGWLASLATDELAGPFAPAGVSLTPNGTVLAADTASHRVVGWRRVA